MGSSGEFLGRLADIVDGELIGSPDIRVTDVTHDSRSVRSGTLFVAIRGFSTDGHEYLNQAVESGASAVCVERQADKITVPQLIVGDSRMVLGRLASEVHGRPSSQLRMVGITGTNGKTTVAHLLESIIVAAGMSAGRIGTTGVSIAGSSFPLPRTTPEASDFQRLLAEMVEHGVDVVAAEVSSHAMALGRVEGVSFEIAAFTNLSQDHLDFHEDMETYFAAKASLFERAATGVVNADDPRGRELIESLSIPVLAVGDDLRATQMELGRFETRFRLVMDGHSESVRLPLAGDFNVSNALVAAGCAIQLGIEMAAIVAGLESVGQIPGRYETVSTESAASVVVDYAHSPDGVRKVIETARATGAGVITVVLGAGGDRDRSKRAEMGKAASLADRFILTSDNPRSESPMEIIEAVRSGVDETAVSLVIEPDRRLAIRQALVGARAADTILVLGKGHEQGQEIAGQIFSFDDIEVVKDELARMEETPCSHC